MPSLPVDSFVDIFTQLGVEIQGKDSLPFALDFNPEL